MNAALHAFLRHPESFRDTVIFAANLGGDTDSHAAMAGSLSGAYLGLRSIPVEWQRALQPFKLPHVDFDLNHMIWMADRLYEASLSQRAGRQAILLGDDELREIKNAIRVGVGLDRLADVVDPLIADQTAHPGGRALYVLRLFAEQGIGGKALEKAIPIFVNCLREGQRPQEEISNAYEGLAGLAAQNIGLEQLASAVRLSIADLSDPLRALPAQKLLAVFAKKEIGKKDLSGAIPLTIRHSGPNCSEELRIAALETVAGLAEAGLGGEELFRVVKDILAIGTHDPEYRYVENWPLVKRAIQTAQTALTALVRHGYRGEDLSQTIGEICLNLGYMRPKDDVSELRQPPQEKSSIAFIQEKIHLPQLTDVIEQLFWNLDDSYGQKAVTRGCRFRLRSRCGPALPG